MLLFGVSLSVAVHLYISENYLLVAVALITMIATVVNTVKLQTSQIKKLEYIVGAIKNRDYTFSFVESTDKQDINSYLNSIKQMLEIAQKEIEDKERYYQYILDNISSGIIVTNQNNSVLRYNKAVSEILSISNISHINNLSSYHIGLTEVFKAVKPLSPQTFSFSTEREQLKISILLTLWEKDGQITKIYTVNNISSELENKEMESWDRLTRVLTHEIMNSLTPIITISSTLVESNKIDDADTVEGLKVISSTGGSLVEFVNNYRKLSRIPTPIMEPIYVESLIDRSVKLFNNSCNTEFEVDINQKDLMIFADDGLIFQVVVNIIKNGIESFGEGRGKIIIDCYCEINEDVVIKISDTGKRIDEDVAESMFIPFFTTKDSGSGIGLSISRQIMRLHNGSISLSQSKDRKSFILKFK